MDFNSYDNIESCGNIAHNILYTNVFCLIYFPILTYQKINLGEKIV